MVTNHFYVTIPPKKGDAAICGHVAQNQPLPYEMGECAQFCRKCIETVNADMRVQLPTVLAH